MGRHLFIIYRETRITITTYLSSKSMQHNENGLISLYIIKEIKKTKSTFQLKILYPVKIFITNKIKIKNFQTNKIGVIIAIRPTVQ